MDPRHSILFEPIEIGPKTIPNRFLQTPHCTSFGTTKPRSQAHHRKVKAEGGWGLIFTEECSIHPEADQFPFVLARLWDDDDVANLALMCDMVHEEGALAGIELWYGGVLPLNMESRGVSRAPSQIVSDAFSMAPCLEMDISDIEIVQGFYVDAALRSRDAGFDVICLYGGHEGLLEQFLSPYYNKRTDNYGGSPENRARMWREVIEKVRAAVGSDMAISVRISADSLRGDDGILLERDVLPFIRACDDIVDLWDVYLGGVDWGDDATPSRFFRSGRALDYVKRIKETTRKPVVAVGRFTDPGAMAQIIKDGVVDIVGAARPTIADPYLPNKIKEGRPEDIRECIGCNICISRFEHGGPPIICTQNATAGEEYRRGWHPEKFDRATNAESDVLILGAGPAGMECARVLGERGMRNVHLVDSEPEMGGHLRWLTQLPGLNEWNRVTDYRMVQLEKLKNVEFIANTRLSAAEAADYGAGIVIVATGSHWSEVGLGPVTRNGLVTSKGANVFTPEDILRDGRELPGTHVTIIDNDGYHVGAGLADMLSSRGKKVTLLTHMAELAPYTNYTLEAGFIRRKLHKQGVKIVTSTIPVSLNEDGVHAHSAYADSDDLQFYPSDAVVLVTQRVSNTGIYRTMQDEIGSVQLLEEGVDSVYKIGDCVAPRIIAEAVFDGHRLAREIDSPNPAIALPYHRERVVELRLERTRPGALTS
ncbi:FAD-dependent oxidoreductase [Rhodococcus sp. IEGM 1354]|uniref:oxidoreductase n=1 Tax=Rhodococcus sp. IEGM 1354 TaxID=3047088 RepID=UPI0024B7E5A1|nr:FAD-dependent oxidoreductase [Rhodococcus sp. IEGM 1354]MDI9929664.1 FAD-dependent oxidoreductase [Rhodococcus sp. IEGM 1354]